MIAFPFDAARNAQCGWVPEFAGTSPMVHQKVRQTAPNLLLPEGSESHHPKAYLGGSVLWALHHPPRTRKATSNLRTICHPVSSNENGHRGVQPTWSAGTHIGGSCVRIISFQLSWLDILHDLWKNCFSRQIDELKREVHMDN